MHEVIYMADYLGPNSDEYEFFWLDSRLGPLLQEIGKIIRRNWKHAEVYFEDISAKSFRIEIVHDSDGERVTEKFIVTKYYA